MSEIPEWKVAWISAKGAYYKLERELSDKEFEKERSKEPDSLFWEKADEHRHLYRYSQIHRTYDNSALRPRHLIRKLSEWELTMIESFRKQDSGEDDY